MLMLTPNGPFMTRPLTEYYVKHIEQNHGAEIKTNNNNSHNENYQQNLNSQTTLTSKRILRIYKKLAVL